MRLPLSCDFVGGDMVGGQHLLEAVDAHQRFLTSLDLRLEGLAVGTAFDYVDAVDLTYNARMELPSAFMISQLDSRGSTSW